MWITAKMKNRYKMNRCKKNRYKKTRRSVVRRLHTHQKSEVLRSPAQPM